jgi:predicted RNA-binding Zn ribbon-like protein
MVTRSEPHYRWDFCGGQLAVDFTNTVGDRGATATEHLNVYGDVLSWAETRGVIAHAEAQRLSAVAARNAAGARDATTTLVALREALYRTIAASARRQRPAASDLTLINTWVAAAYGQPSLASRRGVTSLTFREPAADSLVEPIAIPVARAAVDLLTGDAITRVRSCADHTCGWLFLDTSRNGTRRWCDMAVCGNRSKIRRFRNNS